jgi:hypothetical protein
VTAGGTQVDLAEGETKLIGDLSFTVEANSSFYAGSAAGCDGRDNVSMGGFVVP